MTKKQLTKKLTGATEVTCMLKTGDCETESWPVHTTKFDIEGVCTEHIVNNEGDASIEMSVIKNIEDIVDWALSDPDSNHLWVDAHNYWDEQLY